MGGNHTIRSLTNSKNNGLLPLGAGEFLLLNTLVIASAQNPDVQPLLTQLQDHQVTVTNAEELSSAWLNSYVNKLGGEHLLLIDAQNFSITLRQSAFDLLDLVTKAHADWSMIYSDYETMEEDSISEVHLLDHHIGRVRDNTDFGFVWLINLRKLKKHLPFSSDIEQHWLYDMRLGLSEQGEVVHIANRYAGSLYRVAKNLADQNVFDYLLQSKESQLELERICTHHLERIGACLEEGRGYRSVPYADKHYELTASVIIPVNNRPEFIGAAIESVQRQTIQDIEVIIVVNGGVDDPTVSVVNDYLPGGKLHDPSKPAVKLLVVDINNIGFCLNSGLRAACGKFYVQLDSDDQLTEDAVEKIIAVFGEDDRIGMVIGSYEVWEKQNDNSLTRMESIPVVTHDEWTEANGRNNLLRINGAGAPRSFYIDLADDLGYLDMNTSPYARNYGEDYGMVIRMSEQYRIGRVWDPIYKVIRHGGGTDHSIDQATVDRNDNAKDIMRQEAILRRQKFNEAVNG